MRSYTCYKQRNLLNALETGGLQVSTTRESPYGKGKKGVKYVD